MAPSRALDFFRGQQQSHGPKLSGPISRKIIRGKTWRDLMLAKLSQKYLDHLDRLDRALTVKHRAKFSLANGHLSKHARAAVALAHRTRVNGSDPAPFFFCYAARSIDRQKRFRLGRVFQ